ncbi:MAG TPA: AAA family ATPase [Solirubrobacteraceae bacterium]|nr:AAA family ATPase [Solirubrobacteraceae bacterium]
MKLVERESELTRVAAQWRRARGMGSMVLVGGESGIGKTALVRAFADAVADEAAALWGHCDPLTTPRPLGPLHDVGAELGGRVPELLADAAAAHELFAAVLERLSVARHVLVVDDLHWADSGTLDLLRFLLRRMSSTRSLVIGTFRDDEVGAAHPLRALLADAARSPDVLRLSLRPLSVDGIAAMIGDRPIDAAALHARTGGNPFFAGEVLAGGEDGALPATIRDAVLGRTHGLDPDAREFLDLLACAPQAVPDQALRTLGLGLRQLRALDETGLIRRGRRGLAFRHELCRVAIASAIPPGGEVELHARMVDALEALGTADPAVLAHHALGAGDEARVLRYASLAGLAAARAGAHTQAADFFALAAERGAPATPSERAELLELRAEELYLTDRLQAAIEASEQAMRLREQAGDAGGVGANHRALSVYRWYNANRAVAERHAATAVSVLERAGDPVGLGHAYAMQAYLALQTSEVGRAQTFHDRGRVIADQAGNRPLDVRLRIIDGVVATMRGDERGRERVLSLIARDAEFFDEIYSSGYSNVAYLDVEQRRLRDAEHVLTVSLPLTRERDVPICLVWQTGVRGRLALLRGNWPAAVADAAEVLQGDAAPVACVWPHLVRGLVALRRGDDPPGPDLDDAFALARELGEPLRLLPALAALAEQAWLHGRADRRLDAAPAHLRDVEGIEWSAGDLAVWLWRLGLSTDCSAVPLAAPHRLLLSGRPLEAADAWADLGAPYEQALALVDAGTAEHAAAGLALLDRLGADAVAAKVRRDLRVRGVADIPARRRTTTLANPAGLTARQLEVLRLLDEGLTNAELAERLFISPKTADHHVSAILGKLDVRSRRQAPDAARRLGVAL